MFSAATPELVRRYYPGFDGEVFLHNLQAYLIGRVTRPLVERHLPPGGVAVDLGCGSGTMVKEMSARAATAVGVDLHDRAFGKHPELTIVAEGERDLERRQGAFLAKASLYDVPVGDETVDLVTSRWVFEHLEDPARGVGEIRRILKPGGVALIIVPNWRHPGIFLSGLLPLRVKQAMLGASSGVQEELVIPTYYRANTERALDQHFRSVGLRKLELHYVSDPSYWLFSRLLFRTAAALGAAAQRLPLRRFRMHMIGLYRKEEESSRDGSPA